MDMSKIIIMSVGGQSKDKTDAFNKKLAEKIESIVSPVNTDSTDSKDKK